MYKKFPYLGQPELSIPAYLMHLEPVPKISKPRRKPLEADLGSERDLDRKKHKITFRDVGLEVSLPPSRAWFLSSL